MGKKLGLISKYDIMLATLDEIKWHLEATSANKFEIMAYDRAAHALRENKSLDGAQKLSGFGKTMIGHLNDILANKFPKKLKEVRAASKYPFSISELTKIPSIGVKKAIKLYEEYGVKDLNEFKTAVAKNTIQDVKLLTNYYRLESNNDRVCFDLVNSKMGDILESLSKFSSEPVTMYGSMRRLRADVGDIDVLLCDANIKEVVSFLKKQFGTVTLDGDKKAELYISVAGIERKLDVNFIPKKCWGSAVLHFTGSYEFNRLLRVLSLKQGYSLSQYGAKNKETGKTKRFKTEEQVFDFFGIPYIPPEARDHAKPGEEYKLVRKLYGDLHIHTSASDGQASLKQISKLQDSLYSVGISDHTQATGGGLNDEKMLAHIRQVRNMGMLAGAEIDIASNGALDLSDKTIQELDYGIVSIHTSQDKDVVKRYCNAITTMSRLGVPCIVAHPTNRLIGKRPPCDTSEFHVLFKHASKHGAAIEINGQPYRMDLSDDLILSAKRLGCKFVCSSDTHGKNTDDTTRLLQNAVNQARRGLLEKGDCINASKKTLRSFLKKETK